MSQHLGRGATFAAWLLLGPACSAVQYEYQVRGYDAAAPAALKRIVVAAWAPTSLPSLGKVLAEVAADRIRLTRSYLVYAAETVPHDWPEVCGERDGVLMLRVLDVAGKGPPFSPTSGSLSLSVAASLFDCKTGALVWHARGATTAEIRDADLQNLVEGYRVRLGPEAETWAAPAFVLLQDLFESLPEPALSDEDLMEKIELG